MIGRAATRRKGPISGAQCGGTLGRGGRGRVVEFRDRGRSHPRGLRVRERRRSWGHSTYRLNPNENATDLVGSLETLHELGCTWDEGTARLLALDISADERHLQGIRGHGGWRRQWIMGLRGRTCRSSASNPQTLTGTCFRQNLSARAPPWVKRIEARSFTMTLRMSPFHISRLDHVPEDGSGLPGGPAWHPRGTHHKRPVCALLGDLTADGSALTIPVSAASGYPDVVDLDLEEAVRAAVDGLEVDADRLPGPGVERRGD